MNSDQLPEETDLAYLAYTIFRDMGRGRTAQGAYQLYIENSPRKRPQKADKGRGVSRAFKNWMIKFNWVERAKNWDREVADRVRALAAKDGQKEYADKIEESRLRLEEVAIKGMKAAELAVNTAYKDLVKLAELQEGKSELMGMEELASFTSIVQIVRVSIGTLSAAKSELFDAFGLLLTIEQLAAVNAEFGTLPRQDSEGYR
jgi:hypothetical protein